MSCTVSELTQPPGPCGRVRIWTKSRLRMSAYGRRWISWVSVPSLRMRWICPIGRPTGYSERSLSSGSVPRVTTLSPTSSFASGWVNSSTRSVGLPALAGSTTPNS